MKVKFMMEISLVIKRVHLNIKCIITIDAEEYVIKCIIGHIMAEEDGTMDLNGIERWREIMIKHSKEN